MFNRFTLSSLLLCASAFASASEPQEPAMRIRIDIQGQTLSATLNSQSSAAKDFYSLLPLSLTLTDYAAIEKVADLPKRLSTQGEPSGTAAKAGDITYYAPWGNLAIFHKDFGRASGLVKLGSIEGSLELLRKSGPLAVTIRQAEQ